ncbi:hypothetical protein BST81_18990 [Leptolyngbya sp. 'hensonii']|uniref:DUF2917 domain-containing protein n=1 Tax=Leptolyngbya sp. 'hensonii' TaxID=1922337 RepID=UPI00094F6829|nr:DUF2917 domain-containing protein [Leptolyngbya sp. 'hensonii']OLP16784.1 hypothetical protein BST81_18990 [Leptolyngbya sp. 'hensonii']
MKASIPFFGLRSVPWLNLGKNRADSKVCGLILPATAVISLPRSDRVIEVITGHVWITCNGADVILKAGERFSIPGQNDGVLVSALRNERATMVIWKV